MPSPKSRKSPKNQSPKKSPNKSPPKLKRSEAANSLDNKMDSRIRYSTMGVIFKKCAENVSVYLESIHIYESWNRLPPYEQFCNSNQSPGRSPKSSPGRSKKGSPGKSRKKSPEKSRRSSPKKENDNEINRPDFEPALLNGAIALRKSACTPGAQLIAEVTANFRYTSESRTSTYKENVCTECVCYRKSKIIYPLPFEPSEFTSDFLQQITTKVKSKLGHGYRVIPFTFDLTRCPDSVFLNRPHQRIFTSGIVWTLRIFFAPDLICEPEPGNYISINFYKYTIAPFWLNKSFPPYNPVEYVRQGTANDTGNLVLRAYLERDIYYHGQDIVVTIEVENDSSIYSIPLISVYVEQTYRFRPYLPHDSSIPLGEVVLNSSNSNLPINAKHKFWSKTVTLKPQFDQTKYNLAIDGKLQIDEKVFLASSSMILVTTRTKIPIENSSQIEPREKSPKSSPNRKSENLSPKSKTEKSKKSKSPEKNSPKKGSPKKNSPRKQSPQQKSKDIENNTSKNDAKPLEPEYIEEHHLSNRQICRAIFISYDVVVRLSLEPASGTPMVRLPFILTRESRYLDKFNGAPPPHWSVWKPD